MLRPRPNGDHVRRLLRAAAALALAWTLAACGGASRGGPADVSEATPPTGDAYFAWLDASLLAIEGRNDEAAARLDDAIDLAPGEVPLHLQRAELALRLRDTDRALLHLKIAADLGAPPDDVAVRRARVLQAANRRGEALAVLRAAAAEGNPGDDLFDAWIDLAIEARSWEDARDASQAWTRARPDQPRAWSRLGAARKAEGRGAEAAEAYTRAASLPGGSADDAQAALELHIQREDWDAAWQASELCAQRYREHLQCRVRRVWLLDRTTPNTEAPAEATRAELTRLVQLASRSDTALRRSGELLAMICRTEIVAAYAREIVRQRPRSPSFHSVAASIAYQIGDMDLAIEVLIRAVELDPANAGFLNDLGYFWADRGENLPQAETYIARALEIRPEEAAYIDSLAWVYYRMGRFDEALAQQLRAVALDDRNTVLWDHLGDIYLALGRREDAIVAWRRALAVAGPRDAGYTKRIPGKIRDAEENAP